MNKNELINAMPIIGCGPNENTLLREVVKPEEGDAGVIVVSHDVQPSGPDMVQDVLVLRQDENPDDGTAGDHCLWLGIRRGDGDPVSSLVKVTEDSLNKGDLDYAFSPGRILHSMKPEELVEKTLDVYISLAEKTIKDDSLDG